MQNRRARIPLRTLFVVLLALTACTSNILDLTDPEQIAAVLSAQGLDPTKVIHPHALTDEMRAWVHDAVTGSRSADERLTILQSSLLDPQKISVEYQWGYTGTAIEVFENRRANCLAFTNLFVGMARELGLSVYFLGVSDAETYRKEGDLVVVSDHIAVGHGGLSDRRIFDFSENPPDDYHNFQKLSDITVMAMFHSNRGAEALQRAETEQSVTWLKLAVRIDPNLSTAWVNLGVALRRRGDQAGAEEAYRKAFDIDPSTFSAYQNLASLLRLQGRREEARAYEEMLATSPSRNPYTYLTLGDISLIGGRLEEAEKLYRRAVRLNVRDADAYAALGQLAAASGDGRKARRLMKRAQKMEDSGEHPRLRRLEQALGGG